MNDLNLKYIHSILTPCYCQAMRLIDEGKEIPKITINNANNKVSGEIIERRVELDKINRKHEKIINHCDKCRRVLSNENK